MKNIHRKIISLPEISSTNDLAMKLARQGEPAGTVIEAKTQNAGRGRLGKEWLSPPGTGLYFSIILRPVLPPADLSKITLAAGLGSAVALENYCGLSIRLKWPNDLFLEGKKLGGILCESSPIGHGKDTVVIVGIGLNVNTPVAAFPKKLHKRVTSLSWHGDKTISQPDLMLAMVRLIETQVHRLENGGFSQILTEWRTRDYTMGRELEWLAINGNKVRGISLGPDAQGILQIRDIHGTVHEVLSGDLSLDLGTYPA